ncbi:COG4223 family protein [Yoonia sp. 2307UL14-13]|uniref:COG4223 family protein n=1 Tax=Yoonia sp. 2307UL14-13 TaxID=3126506 RepID=UPI003099C0E8
MAKQPAKGRKTPQKPTNTAANAKSTDESLVTELRIDAIPPEVHAVSAPLALEKPVKPAPEPEKVATAEEQKPAPKRAETPKSQPQPARRGGFFPLLLGGLLAGAIGLAVGVLNPNGTDGALSEQVAAQGESIATLESQVADMPTVDISGIETAQNYFATEIAGFGDRLSELDERLAALENLPVGDGTMSERAISAFEAELDALRAELATMSDSAATQLAEARAEAESIEENAEAAARAAAGRAALARIRTSLNDGAPLGAALGDLEDAIAAPAPNALLNAQGGVPTLAALQESFPEVATAALAAARSAGVSGEETGGAGAFFRNQFNVRSTTPQEGATTDAILSRAEAAVKAGRLSDALAEIAALPEEARVEMSDWLAQAETRAAAIDAVEVLSTSLNDS